MSSVTSALRMRRAIHPDTRIGHVHLQVADIERALRFYRDLLGFEVTQWEGEDAVFLSAGGYPGGYHHHIALNTWAGRDIPPAPRKAAGLFHLAILYPERRELAKALKVLLDAQYPIDGASEHGVCEALYLRDPDQIPVELYWDRPREEWPHTQEGKLAMGNVPLDVKDLLAELVEGAADDIGLQKKGKRGPRRTLPKVIERVKAHYEIQEVEMGKVYRWRPQSLVLECICGEQLTLSAFKTTSCAHCGADHVAIAQEMLEARPEDKGDHPWRYLQPYTPTPGT